MEQEERILLSDIINLDINLLRDKKVVGVTAGASAPEIIFTDVLDYLTNLGAVIENFDNEDRLENIKILNSDIVPFLENNVQECSFDLVLMFYPDPWPKRKHHKRRLLQKDFLELLHSKLKKGGIFYFKTDWDHYFQEVNKIFLDEDKWQIIKKSDF